MQQYILRRLLLAVPVLWGATLIVFVAIRIAPGDVLMSQVENIAAIDPQTRARLLQELGLDVPGYIQYGHWVSGVVRGDLGRSLVTREPVLQEIVRRVPISAEIAVLATVVAVLIAWPLGMIAAAKQDHLLDYVSRFLSIFWISVPNFVIGTAIILLPAIWWRYSPPLSYSTFWENPAQNLQKCLPAAIALGAVLSGVSTRMMRSTMLNVLREDYIRTARAKGVAEGAVVAGHALKNAIIPVVTIVGVQFGALLGGTIIVETLFGIPGLGTLTSSAIQNKDYTLIQGVTLFFALVNVAVNLFVDLLYGWLDPRIRFD